MITVVGRDGGTVLVRLSGPRSEFLVDLARVKAIPGAVWDSEAKLWSIPAQHEPMLDSGYLEPPAKFDGSTVTDVVPDNREVESGLFRGLDLEFQRVGASFLYSKKRACLFDEFGLGKTIQALRAILKGKLDGTIEKTLVVTKSSLKAQWAAEVTKFSPLRAVVVRGDRKARAKAWAQAADADLVAINYELLLQDLDFKAASATKWSCIVVDEAQMVRTRTAKRTRALAKLKSDYLFVLTATPIQNRAEEIYSIFKLVNRDVLGKWTDFAREHIVFDAWWKPCSYRGLHEIARKIAPYCLRRSVESVGQEMPEVVRSIYEVEMTPLQRRLHDELGAELEEVKSELREFGMSTSMPAGSGGHAFPGNLQGLDAESVERVLELQNRQLGLYTLMLEVCDSPRLLAMSDAQGVRARVKGVEQSEMESPKLIELMVIIDEWMERNEKLVVFSQFPNMLELVAEKLDSKQIHYAMLYGSMPTSCGRSDCGVCDKGKFLLCNCRQKSQWRFWNEPDCMVFLSTDAGGAGLNLQCASAMVDVDLPWNPSDAEQRHGRIRRIGSPYKMVRVIELLTEDGMDRQILDSHARKEDIIETVLGAIGKS